MAKKLQELYSEAAFLQVQYMNDQTHRVNQRRRGWLPRLKEIRTRKGNNYNQFCERDRKEITDRCQERMGKVCKLRPQHC